MIEHVALLDAEVVRVRRVEVLKVASDLWLCAPRDRHADPGTDGRADSAADVCANGHADGDACPLANRHADPCSERNANAEPFVNAKYLASARTVTRPIPCADRFSDSGADRHSSGGADTSANATSITESKQQSDSCTI